MEHGKQNKSYIAHLIEHGKHNNKKDDYTFHIVQVGLVIMINVAFVNSMQLLTVTSG